MTTLVKIKKTVSSDLDHTSQKVMWNLRFAFIFEPKRADLMKKKRRTLRCKVLNTFCKQAFSVLRACLWLTLYEIYRF